MFEAPRQIQSAAAGGANAAVDFSRREWHRRSERFLSVLWRGKATILWTIVAFAADRVLLVLSCRHRYTAVTQILIDPTDLRAHRQRTGAGKSSQRRQPCLQVESQVRVLTSDSVLRRVVKTEGLNKDPEFTRQGSSDGADSTTAALIALKRSIAVKRAERTYVVDVIVTTREAAKSARIANAIADAYLQEQTDVRSDAARQVSQSLSARLNELKDRVREAEDRVEAFKARHNILGASGQLVNEQQLTEMNNQLTTGARAHGGGEGTARPSPAGAAFQERGRRLSRGGAVADYHRAAQPIRRGHAARGRADDVARRPPSGRDRDPGGSRAALGG